MVNREAQYLHIQLSPQCLTFPWEWTLIQQPLKINLPFVAKTKYHFARHIEKDILI